MRSRFTSRSDADRYLVDRDGTYQYKRRVPLIVADLDDRAPHVRVSLKTRDLAIARLKRDALEAADDALWGELLGGGDAGLAQQRYKAAVRRAAALGFGYRPTVEIAAQVTEGELVARVETAIADRSRPVVDAVLGRVAQPRITILAAMKVYLDEIVSSQLVSKSAEQRRQWKKIPLRAANNLVALIGDKDLSEIVRDDALKLHALWRRRIAPSEGEGAPTHSASSGNRDLGALRVFYRDYFRHLGDRDRKNPFDDLSFTERKKKRRPAFSAEWLATRIMAPGALEDLNAEARGILLGMIEVGARPSELVALDARTIVLDHPIPHLVIEPSEDPDDPRELKSPASTRIVPLLGVSLAVFQAFPTGFPRYRKAKGGNSTQLINKFLRQHKLVPTDKHTAYSVRHGFEDRMKDGGLDTELRMILMGHAIDRPQYGEGGSLQWKRDELAKITLAFDPEIVTRQVVRSSRAAAARRRTASRAA